MVELAQKRVVQCPDLLDVNSPHVLVLVFRSDEMRAVGIAMSLLAGFELRPDRVEKDPGIVSNIANP